MIKPKKYFIGLYKKSETTLVLQATTNKDCLSCELWKYYGERLTTKDDLKSQKGKLLIAINEAYKTTFQHLIIE